MGGGDAGALRGAGVSAPRVLLFGANGQLGYRLKELLGDACVALGRTECDFSTLTEPQAVALIGHHAPSVIINAAAFTAVDAAESQPDLAMRINAHAPAMLARAAGNIPFLHVSTDYVFDGTHAPYTEAAAPSPLNAYGRSKWLGEQQVREAGGHAVILRLQWLYDTRGSNFYRTMRRLMAQQPVLRVVADQFGAPTSATSAAAAVLRMADLVAQHSLAAGTYHLACGGHTSWHGFACAIAAGHAPAMLERIEPVRTREYPTPAARPRDTRLDCGALARHGIVLPHWRAALAQAMEE